MAGIAGAAAVIAEVVPAATALIQIVERLIGVVHTLHMEGGSAASESQIAELRQRLEETNTRVQAVTFP